MQAVVIAIIAAVIGLGIGYATWGSPSSQAEKDLAAAQTPVEEARKAAGAERPGVATPGAT